MPDGEIEGVSEAIGQLREGVRGIGDQVGRLTQQWMQQERSASQGRRLMYERLNVLGLELSALKLTVEAMKPIVDAGHAAHLRDTGVRNLLRLLWLGLVALIGALGASVVNWFSRAPLPPHH